MERDCLIHHRLFSTQSGRSQSWGSNGRFLIVAATQPQMMVSVRFHHWRGKAPTDEKHYSRRPIDQLQPDKGVDIRAGRNRQTGGWANETGPQAAIYQPGMWSWLC